MIALSLSSLSVSLAGRAGHAFAAPTMMQGFACHARGVEIRHRSDEEVRARVRSKRTYDVVLRAERGRLVLRCQCPGRSMGLSVCKHMWAALLEVDREGGLDGLRTVPGTLAVVTDPPVVTAEQPAAPDPISAPDAEEPRGKAKAARPGKDDGKPRSEKKKATAKVSPRGPRSPRATDAPRGARGRPRRSRRAA